MVFPAFMKFSTESKTEARSVSAFLDRPFFRPPPTPPPRFSRVCTNVVTWMEEEEEEEKDGHVFIVNAELEKLLAF